MNSQNALSKRDLYLKKYNSGRSNLLTMILFTIVNVALCLFKSTSYFLFSAQVPYFLVYEGMWWAGRMPDESYIEAFGATKEEVAFLPTTAFYVMVAFAVSIILLYVLCWVFSKKSPGWLTAALVLFVLDTVVLVLVSLFYYIFDASMIIDFAFHALVIGYLISGINAARKLKKLPEAEPTDEQTPAPVEVSKLNGEEEKGAEE